MDKTELYHAWAWTCDHCGCENFTRSISKEFCSEAEKLNWYRDFQPEGELPEDFEELECFMYPDIVECRECDTQYETFVAPDWECE